MQVHVGLAPEPRRLQGAGERCRQHDWGPCLTTTLIVLAHPNPTSFNGAWAQASVRACEALGDTVLVSDLVTMTFQAVEQAQNYSDPPESPGFDPLKAQERASVAQRLPEDVQREIDKLQRADRVIFHFPIWWFAPPAILKGWFDRVLVHGALHTVERRFDQGRCRGKTALFCVTTGSSAAESAYNGKEGDIQLVLWPAAYTLRHLGFSVAVPEILHEVHGYHQGASKDALDQRLAAALAGQSRLIAELEHRPLIAFPPDDDFTPEGRLKPDRPSHSPFIRHRP